MNAPDAFLTARIGEAEIRVPREAAIVAYLEQLLDQRRPLPAMLTASAERLGAALEDKIASLPGIGEPWSNEKLEEVYAGLTLHNNAPHALVLLPGDRDDGSWKDAIAWAIGTGGVLPSRFDALVLFQNLRGHFKKEAYWTSEQHADDSAYAWYQGFGWGYQSHYHVSGKLRARAVRRVPL